MNGKSRHLSQTLILTSLNVNCDLWFMTSEIWKKTWTELNQTKPNKMKRNCRSKDINSYTRTQNLTGSKTQQSNRNLPHWANHHKPHSNYYKKPHLISPYKPHLKKSTKHVKNLITKQNLNYQISNLKVRSSLENPICNSKQKERRTWNYYPVYCCEEEDGFGRVRCEDGDVGFLKKAPVWASLRGCVLLG